MMMKFYNNIPHNFPVINVTLKTTRNVGQCPTWWSPCRI